MRKILLCSILLIGASAFCDGSSRGQSNTAQSPPPPDRHDVIVIDVPMMAYGAHQYDLKMLHVDAFVAERPVTAAITIIDQGEAINGPIRAVEAVARPPTA
jgi:hypothetical protein